MGSLGGPTLKLVHATQTCMLALLLDEFGGFTHFSRPVGWGSQLIAPALQLCSAALLCSCAPSPSPGGGEGSLLGKVTCTLAKSTRLRSLSIWLIWEAF